MSHRVSTALEVAVAAIAAGLLAGAYRLWFVGRFWWFVGFCIAVVAIIYAIDALVRSRQRRQPRRTAVID